MTALTDILTAHTDEGRLFSMSDLGYLIVQCACGVECGPRKGDHAAHVEAELLAAGIVAVRAEEIERLRRLPIDVKFIADDLLKTSNSDKVHWHARNLAVNTRNNLMSDYFQAVPTDPPAANAADRPTPTPGDPTP